MSCNCEEAKKAALELKDHIPMMAMGQLSPTTLDWIAKNAGTNKNVVKSD